MACPSTQREAKTYMAGSRSTVVKRDKSQANTQAWRKVLVKAGIENFRWHDLRHTWASWHVQNGTPLNVLQELGGWESTDMVRRYAHLSASHLVNYAENVVPKTTKLVQRNNVVKLA